MFNISESVKKVIKFFLGLNFFVLAGVLAISILHSFFSGEGVFHIFISNMDTVASISGVILLVITGASLMPK